MNPLIGLSLGRIGIGALSLVSPETAARMFQLDAQANPQVPYVMRLFGAREVALGVVTLFARGRALKALAGVGVMVDLADAGTGYLAMQEGAVSRKTAMTLVVPALGAAGSGVMAIVRRR